MASQPPVAHIRKQNAPLRINRLKTAMNTSCATSSNNKILVRRTRYVKSDIAGTLTSHFRGSPDGDGRTGVIEDMVIRRLTPTECERLRGFPDGWTEGISDTQRYKTLGNAVTVNVIKAIMEKIYA